MTLVLFNSSSLTLDSYFSRDLMITPDTIAGGLLTVGTATLLFNATVILSYWCTTRLLFCNRGPNGLSPIDGLSPTDDLSPIDNLAPFDTAESEPPFALNPRNQQDQQMSALNQHDPALNQQMPASIQQDPAAFTQDGLASFETDELQNAINENDVTMKSSGSNYLFTYSANPSPERLFVSVIDAPAEKLVNLNGMVIPLKTFLGIIELIQAPAATVPVQTTLQRPITQSSESVKCSTTNGALFTIKGASVPLVLKALLELKTLV